MAKKKKIKANDTRLSAKRHVFPIFMLFVGMLCLIGGVCLVNYFMSGKTSSDSGIGKVYINEVMTSNKGTLLAPDGSSADWVELYNTERDRMCQTVRSRKQEYEVNMTGTAGDMASAPYTEMQKF